MNCKQFTDLPHQEQKEFLGELIHACISSNWCYESAKEIIAFAKMQGKFIGVKIGNDAFREDEKLFDRELYELEQSRNKETNLLTDKN